MELSSEELITTETQRIVTQFSSVTPWCIAVHPTSGAFGESGKKFIEKGKPTPQAGANLIQVSRVLVSVI